MKARNLFITGGLALCTLLASCATERCGIEKANRKEYKRAVREEKRAHRRGYSFLEQQHQDNSSHMFAASHIVTADTDAVAAFAPLAFQ